MEKNLEDERKVVIKTGTKIVLTKILKKPRVKSVFEIGQKLSGTLTMDVEYGRPLYLKEFDGRATTSNVIASYNQLCDTKTILIMETQKSIYSVRIVEDDNDEEFKKWSI
ncbi:MAG: hypothetical protein WCK37_03830 [Candidatus Falkowbacteria bacterium]